VEGGGHDRQTYHLQRRVDFFEDVWYADPMHLAYRGLQIEQRHPEYQHRYHVRDQKHASSILVDQVREPPKGTEAHTYADSAHDVLPLIVVDVRVVGVVRYL
jgi:hypothetical protein